MIRQGSGVTWCLFAPLLLVSCSQKMDQETAQQRDQESYSVSKDNLVGRAAEGRSLVFPLSDYGFQEDSDFIAVRGAGAKDIDAKELTYAVSMCSSFGVTWFDINDHWRAIVTPSSESSFISGVAVSKPADEEMINCVKKYYDGTFFYKTHNKGYDTFKPNLR